MKNTNLLKVLGGVSLFAAVISFVPVKAEAIAAAAARQARAAQASPAAAPNAASAASAASAAVEVAALSDLDQDIKAVDARIARTEAEAKDRTLTDPQARAFATQVEQSLGLRNERVGKKVGQLAKNSGWALFEAHKKFASDVYAAQKAEWAGYANSARELAKLTQAQRLSATGLRIAEEAGVYAQARNVVSPITDRQIDELLFRGDNLRLDRSEILQAIVRMAPEELARTTDRFVGDAMEPTTIDAKKASLKSFIRRALPREKLEALKISGFKAALDGTYETDDEE